MPEYGRPQPDGELTPEQRQKRNNEILGDWLRVVANRTQDQAVARWFGKLAEGDTDTASIEEVTADVEHPEGTVGRTET